MIQLLISIVVIVVFANAANKRGKNPINWALIGVASFMTPSFLVTGLASMLSTPGYLGSKSSVQFWAIAYVLALIAGIAVSVLTYAKITERGTDQES